MNVKLSEGSLATIMSGGTVENPIVQVLGSRKIVGNEASDRYRLLISDGINVLSFAMLGTQLNEKVVSGELSNNTIIKIKHHITSLVNNAAKGQKRVMIILALDIIAKGEVVGIKIGNPVPIRDDSSSDHNSNAQPKPQFGQGGPQQSGGMNNTLRPAQSTNAPKVVPASPGPTAASHPIASLSPYQNKWVIKARVTNKSTIRTWSNSRGEGKLFSVDLVDESGEIRATAFNEQCDTFYEMLEINKVYFIKGCRLKGANKKFSSIQNEYEMTFTQDTQVVPCYEETSSIPSVTFNFQTINNLLNAPAETLVDVIGVCKSAADVQSLVARTTQRELKKRDVTLVDNSNTEVTLTLWGSQAEEFDGSQHPVVAVKGARVSDFSGKSLSLLGSSLMRINPDIPEAHKLRGWYDNVGCNQESQSISKSGGGAGGGGSSQFKLLAEMKTDGLGGGEKPDYFSCKAYIMMVKKEGLMYQACPEPDCNKKVIDMCNGMYRCEKCAKEFPNFKWRMILSANIGDATDHAWVTGFQETGEKVMGMSTDELATLKNKEDQEEYDAVFQNANFRCFNFRLRTKMETYNEEKRLKTNIVQADPVNYVEYNRRLLTELKEAFA
ncbi:replication protein A 70 kDa DNA-binding subunit [Ischnura elegans]|uniref:replication protein A 70 kDa DNA-binding subunit n=1 Tax=Ischnura elegans TaxID=197161 RepID=UPI001ED86B83|nr:replication protein A 70 kDa DNA-binding subunit [Ischnura elegans]